jgi:uncharacterized membrane protein YadS
MIQEFCNWLAGTRLSQAFADTAWFVPLVQTIHIVSIAVVLATVMRLDVLLLRPNRQGPTLSQMANSYLPWYWWALLVLLVTGTLLTITEPGRELMNNAFRLKMLMVIILASLTLFVQRSLDKDPQYWSTRSGLGSVIGVTSLVLCVLIVAAGRLIAYV